MSYLVDGEQLVGGQLSLGMRAKHSPPKSEWLQSVAFSDGCLRMRIDSAAACEGPAGPSSRYSVLDKVVPGYYHRLEADGSLCGSAFGANNAPEHAMMERLVIDDLLHWAVHYKALSPAARPHCSERVSNLSLRAYRH